MTTPEKFRRYAAECLAMGKMARSPESKATWGQLAARWNQCAEIAQRQPVTPPTERAMRHDRHRRFRGQPHAA
jgi:hypothetical protein